MKDQSQKNNSINDPELKEWLDALENIINEDGNDRASFILGKLASKLTESGTIPDFNLTTPFRNSIPVNEEAKMPRGSFHGTQDKISYKMECFGNGFEG